MIPLHPYVRAIFEKYGDKAPANMSDQKINDYIKEVAMDCGIDEVEYVKRTIGGKKVTLKKYRYQLVTTHTARRSFCTNAYRAGIGTVELMKISGHKTEKAFLNYLKLTKEEIALNMATHPFFSGN